MASTQNLLTEIIKSLVYKNALRKSPKIARNASSLLKLLQASLTKTKKMGIGGIFDVIREKITLMGTLVKAYAIGDYRQVEISNLLKIIAAFIYFISPIDIIPDFLPFIGLTDDVTLLVFIFKSIDGELVKFSQWQKNSPHS